MNIPVSILILSYNEEKNIKYALDSAQWADEVFVVDSFSTDKTLGIAKNYANAKIFQHAFENFSRQRNWALTTLPFKNEWVFILDCDEKIPESLKEEIEKIVKDAKNEINSYRCAYRLIFLNRWIKHCAWYPFYNTRLFRLGKARYEDRGANEYVITEGKIGYLKNDLIHESRNGIQDWLVKHNRYSSFEAREIYSKKRAGFHGRLFGDAMERRKFLKNLSYKLPFRSILRFIYMYFWGLGFLDGYPGFVFCVLQAIQEFHINVKLYELRKKNQNNLLE